MRALYHRVCDCSLLDVPDREPTVAAFQTHFWQGTTWSAHKSCGDETSGAGRAGQLLFVPSYFDYVRVRALAKAEDAEFAALSEYAKVLRTPRLCYWGFRHMSRT